MSVRRKSAPSSIVHQPAAQFYERFVEGIKQRIRTEKLLSASPSEGSFRQILLPKILLDVLT